MKACSFDPQVLAYSVHYLKVYVMISQVAIPLPDYLEA